MVFDPTEHPHRRYDPLADSWVLVSPHRTKRPWQGAVELAVADRPSYDPTCYLCPGNTRASGETNPPYEGTFTFQNDFAALQGDVLSGGFEGLYKCQPVAGESRVICFSPRHDKTLAELDQRETLQVIKTWMDQAEELGSRWQYVQIFENKGAVMGCSNPHPHGQVWAGNWIPVLVQRECDAQAAHWQTTGRALLDDVVKAELEDRTRIVGENEDWIVIVPFWAQWPFETLLLPKFPAQRIPELTSSQQTSLAGVLKDLLVRYDNLFETEFPYSMGWHGAPFDGNDHPEWRLHAHFYPPLLRSASVKKFMVGYEMLAEPQRDLTAEQAAERLRSVSAVHYKSR